MDENYCLLNGEIFTTFNAIFICFLKFRSIVKKKCLPGMILHYSHLAPTGVKIRNKTKQHGKALRFGVKDLRYRVSCMS